MKRRARPVPAYKARRAARLEERRQLDREIESIRLTGEFLRARMEAQLQAWRKADQEKAARAKARQPSFFERLLNAATETTDRLAQDFEPQKGPGDARFFG